MELIPFNDFDTHITEHTNKQTNKQTSKQAQLVSAFKVPKGETKVWAIATATLPRGMKVKKHQVGSSDFSRIFPRFNLEAWSKLISK